MATSKGETEQAAVVRVAKKVTITAETESPVVVSTSRMGLMTIEVVTVDNPTSYLIIAREVYETKSTFPFLILVTNF